MAAKAKKQSKLALVAMCAAVIGLVLYIVSSLIFPSKSILAFPVIVLTACALLFTALVAFAGESLPKILRDICILLGGLCLVASIGFFVLNRVDPAADIWFIPVNYPAAEKTSLYISCVGIAFYCVSYIAVTIKAFTTKD